MMSAFVEKAKEYLSNATGAAFRQEWELFDKECEAFSAHLEAREAVTRQLAEALTIISKIPNQPFGHDYEEIDDARVIALMALQAYDEASKT